MGFFCEGVGLLCLHILAQFVYIIGNSGMFIYNTNTYRHELYQKYLEVSVQKIVTKPHHHKPARFVTKKLAIPLAIIVNSFRNPVIALYNIFHPDKAI